MSFRATVFFLLAEVCSAASDHVSKALAADGECRQGPDGDAIDPDCAVNVLQRVAHGFSTSQDRLGLTGECDEDTLCDAGRMCVTKADKTWSQCVPTERDEFQADCKNWDKDMREAALPIMQCDTAKCESSAECSAGWYCVAKADDSWAQCVPSSAKHFRRMCVHWTDDFRLPAIKAIGLNCPNSRCYSNEWCLHGHRCAAGDGWGQCISCKKKTFETNCYSWTSEFADAAESVCGHECKHIKQIGYQR